MNKKMNFVTLKEEVQSVVSRCQGRVGLIIETGNDRIEINNRMKFSAASLIKIPILIECFRQSEKGVLDLLQIIPVLTADRVGGSGVVQVLSDDVQLKVIDLMTLMIIVSDNTATNLLIDRLGLTKINQCMKTLNLGNTELNRKMMDFEALKSGVDNWTTANDMLICLKAIDQNKTLSKENAKHALNILEKQQFKNKLSDFMNLEKIQVANKTGELPGVEHDCAIIRHESKTVYATILIDQLTEQKDGRQTMAHIGKLISQYIVRK